LIIKLYAHCVYVQLNEVRVFHGIAIALLRSQPDRIIKGMETLDRFSETPILPRQWKETDMKRLCVALGVALAAVIFAASADAAPPGGGKGGSKSGGSKSGGHGHGHHGHGHHGHGHHGHGHHSHGHHRHGHHHHGHHHHGHHYRHHHYRHHHYSSWRHYCWFPTYGCYGYYCPSACSWYYYYAPQQCYYPISYITTYAPTTPGITINVNNNNNLNNNNVGASATDGAVPVGPAVAAPPLPTGATGLPAGFVPGTTAPPKM
jgi:hypothetical protein